MGLEIWYRLEDYILPVGLGALMAYMLFIIWQLGRESKAGRFGMLVLFLALGLGIFGFIAKHLIQFVLER